jgi:hypothetical protein
LSVAVGFFIVSANLLFLGVRTLVLADGRGKTWVQIPVNQFFD